MMSSHEPASIGLAPSSPLLEDDALSETWPSTASDSHSTSPPSSSDATSPKASKFSNLEDLSAAYGEVEVADAPVDEDGRIKFSWKTLWGYTGPGLLMSIAYLVRECTRYI